MPGPKIPAAKVYDSSPIYGDEDASATGVLSPLRNTMAKLEQQGVILRTPSGQYVPSEAVTSTQHGGPMGVYMPTGWKMAGIYHSHTGNSPEENTYSDTDVQEANRLHVPSYILFQDSGRVGKYTPGDPYSGYTDGHTVAAPPPAAVAHPIPNWDKSFAQVAPDPRQQMLAEALRAEPDQQRDQ